MRRAAILALLITVPWVAIGGLVSLIFHGAVMEVIALELTAIALGLVTALLMMADLADDVLGPRT